MKAILRTCAWLLLLASSARAALAIDILPSQQGRTTWILTQISPSPDIDILNVSGSGGSIELPTSMFDPAWLLAASGVSLTADFSATFATVLEQYSNQTFLISTFSAGIHPALEFDQPYTLPNGNTSARFDISGTSPADLGIGIDAFVPGIHTINSTFGILTVTVVPEPSSAVLSIPLILGILRRHRPTTPVIP